jgi:hypothetical protein
MTPGVSAPILQIPGAFTTCTATSGSGSRTAGTRATTAPRATAVPGRAAIAASGCCAGAAGYWVPELLRSAGRNGPAPASGAISSAFGLPGRSAESGTLAPTTPCEAQRSRAFGLQGALQRTLWDGKQCQLDQPQNGAVEGHDGAQRPFGGVQNSPRASVPTPVPSGTVGWAASSTTPTRAATRHWPAPGVGASPATDFEELPAGRHLLAC